MSQLTSELCFCGAASPNVRRSAVLERVCLKAHLRARIGGAAEALVLYYAASVPAHVNGDLRGSYAVTNLRVCPSGCLSTEDVLGALAHGFSRVFIELSPDIRLIHRQLDLVEDIAACAGLDGTVALFHSENALSVLLDDPIKDDADAAIPPEPRAETEAPSVAGYVSLTDGCTLCQHCVWSCPTDAMHLGDAGNTLEIRDQACTGCGLCASACPERVLSILPVATALCSA
ncbi:4Fe-4S binding protein [Tritonibacter mobilis]|nr:4Fe-4S binding protein [Tritonibacter mobilis]